MSLCKEPSRALTKLTTQLLVLDVESEGPSRDQPKGVCIAIGSPRRLLPALIGQNNSGTFAPISNVTVEPLSVGKDRSLKCGISFSLSFTAGLPQLFRSRPLLIF